MLKEFKAFAMRGNVIDLAVGVIIGAAFGKIVTSLVNDLLMPLLGKLTGGVSFVQHFVALDGNEYETIEAARTAGVPVLAYGSFIQTIFDFIIVAFSIFLFVKGINRMKKKEEEKPAAPAPPPADVVLLTEIRDLLKAK